LGKASRERAGRREAAASHPRPAPEERPGPAPGGLRPFWEVPWTLALLLLAAAIFRAIYFWRFAHTSIFFDGLILDSTIYDDWARAIVGGDWLHHQAFYLPPLYPYLLGVLYGTLGHSYALVDLVQQLLGILNLLLIHRVAETLFGRRVALYAACGAALYGPFAFFETKILATTLGLTLNLVVLLMLVRAERGAPPGGRVPSGRAFIAGLSIGVAALCLPATVLLAPLYVLLGLRRDGRAAGLLLAGTLVGLSPVPIHNLAVAGDPLVLSGQGGITFYQGNHPGAAGLYTQVPGFSGDPEAQAREERAIAEREAGRPLLRSQVSAHFFGKGLAYILGSPGSWLLLEARKLGYLLGDYEASTEYSLLLERSRIPWLWLPLLPYAAIIAAAVGGLWLLRREPPGRRGGAGLAAYTLYAAAIPLLFYVSSRYRLPLVPALLIYGAVFVDAMVTRWRAGTPWGRVHAGAAAAALCVGLVSYIPLGRPSVSAEANVHYNIGSLLADRGRYQEAIEEYDRALARWPGNVFAWINRGNSLDRLGREDEALASYRRAQEVDAGFWTAYAAQGVILHREKRYADEVEVYRRGLRAGGAEAHFLLGTALFAQGRSTEINDMALIEEAAREFREAVRLRPREARFQNSLAMVLARTGDRQGAIAAYREANRIDPSYEKSRYNLGLLYLDHGDLAEAEEMLREAVRIAPGYAHAHGRLGETLARSGKTTEARRELERALALDPNDASARVALAKLGR
jgi:tetratricopeptide (TPR) repeat protein